jgi:hypothetical protein
MWAGLLASSCSEGGEDDSNITFTNIMQQLTSVQAKILAHACKNAIKNEFYDGLVCSPNDAHYGISFDELVEIAGISDITRLSMELRQLLNLNLLRRTLATAYGLMQTRPPTKSSDKVHPIGLEPTPLAFTFYARCNGSREMPSTFYGVASPRAGG